MAYVKYFIFFGPNRESSIIWMSFTAISVESTKVVFQKAVLGACLGMFKRWAEGHHLA